MKLHLPPSLRRALIALFFCPAFCISSSFADNNEDDILLLAEDLSYRNIVSTKTMWSDWSTENYCAGGSALAKNTSKLEFKNYGTIDVIGNGKSISYNVAYGNIRYFGGALQGVGAEIADNINVNINDNYISISGTRNSDMMVVGKIKVEARGGAIASYYAEDATSNSGVQSGNVLMSNNENLSLCRNYINILNCDKNGSISEQLKKAYGGAIYGSNVTISDNGSITISDNYIKSDIASQYTYGGAIYGTTRIESNRGDITISGNSAECGGAISGTTIITGNLGKISIYENAAVEGGFVNGNLTMTGNQDIEFCRNSLLEGTKPTGSVAKGDALTLEGNKHILIEDNDYTAFAVTEVQLKGNSGGITLKDNEIVFQSTNIKVENNGHISISNNAAAFSASNLTIHGNSGIESIGNRGTIFSGSSGVSICGNGDINLHDNKGSALYSDGGLITLAHNEQVQILNNTGYGINGNALEIYDNAEVTLRGNTQGIKIGSGDVVLSTHKDNIIGFYDTVQKGAGGNIFINADYEDTQGVLQRAAGAIIFGGQAESALQALATQYGGTLRVEDGATLTFNGYQTYTNRQAVLELANATLSTGAYDTILGSGHSIRTTGCATLSADELVLTHGAVLELELSREHLQTAALSLNANVFAGELQLDLTAAENLAAGSYKLITLGTPEQWLSEELWSSEWVKVSGLNADFADLAWSGGTLYLNYKTNTPVADTAEALDFTWQAAYKLPTTGYTTATVSSAAAMQNYADNAAKLALSIAGDIRLAAADAPRWAADSPLMQTEHLILAGRSTGTDTLEVMDAAGKLTAGSLTLANLAHVTLKENDANLVSGEMEIRNNGVVVLFSNNAEIQNGTALTIADNGFIWVSENAVTPFTISGDIILSGTTGKAEFCYNSSVIFKAGGDAKIIDNSGMVLFNNNKLIEAKNVFIERNEDFCIQNGGSISATENITLSNDKKLEFSHVGTALQAMENVNISGNGDIIFSACNRAIEATNGDITISGNTGNIDIDAADAYYSSIEATNGSIIFRDNAGYLKIQNGGYSSSGLWAAANITLHGQGGEIYIGNNTKFGIRSYYTEISNNKGAISIVSNANGGINAYYVSIFENKDAEILLQGNKSLSSSLGGAGIYAWQIDLSKNKKLIFKDNAAAAPSSSNEYGYGGAIVATQELQINNNTELQFLNNTAGSKGGAITTSVLEWLSNNHALFQGNYASSYGGAICGAAYEGNLKFFGGGSMEFISNNGYSGGAVYGYAMQFGWFDTLNFSQNTGRNGAGALRATGLLMYNTQKVIFEKNSTLYGNGGAVILSANESTFNNIGALYFGENSAKADSSSRGGALAIEGGSTTSILGDYKNGSATEVDFKQNQATATNKSGKAYGGAVSVLGANPGSSSSFVLSGNGDTSFLNNEATATSGQAFGGAISAVNSALELVGNGSVEFEWNRTNSTDSKGGALYLEKSKLRIYDNELVSFIGNFEVSNGVVRLRSIYYHDGLADAPPCLSAPENGFINIFDSVYIDASGEDKNVFLNFDKTTNSITTGEILISGGYTADVIAEIKGSAATAEEIELSRTSVMNGNVDLMGGRLVIADSAVLNSTGFDVMGEAELYLYNGTLNLQDPVNNAVKYDLNVSPNGVLHGTHGGFLKAGLVTMANSSVLRFSLTDHELEHAALTISGTLIFNGLLTLDIRALNEETPLTSGTYKLLHVDGNRSGWNPFNITCEGLADTSSLYWENNTLYFNYVLASLEWNGASGDVWSVGGEDVWVSEQGAATFRNGASVTFNKGGNVQLSGQVKPSAVVVSGTQALTLGGSGSITGETSLVKEGTGALNMNAANEYTGGTVLNGGTVTAGGKDSFGSGAIDLKGGTLKLGGNAVNNAITATGGALHATAYAGTLTVNGNLTLGNNTKAGQLVLQNGSISSGSITNTPIVAQNGTINSAIGGSSSLTVNGAGTVTLSAGNTYTGQTRIDAGTLKVTGSLKSDISLNGGVLHTNNGMSLVSGQELTAAGGQVTGNLTTASGSAITLLNQLNIDGNLTLGGGTLSLGANTLTLSGNLVLSANTKLELKAPETEGVYTIANYASLSGNLGYLNLADSDVSRLKYTLVNTGTSLQLKATHGQLALHWQGGQGTWAANEAGHWLTAANVAQNYEQGDSVSFSSGGQVTLVGNLTPAAMSVSGSAGLTLQGSGSIAGATSLTKSGSGALLMNADNQYTGGTVINGGTVTAGGAASFGSGTINLNGGTLNLANYAVSNDISAAGGTLQATAYKGDLTVTSHVSLGNNTQANAIYLESGSLSNGSIANTTIYASSGTISSTLTGSSYLIIDGDGIVTLKGNHTASAMPTVINSGTLRMEGNIGSDIIMSGGTLDTVNGLRLEDGRMLMVGGADIRILGNLTCVDDSYLSALMDMEITGSLTMGGSSSLELCESVLRVGGSLIIDDTTFLSVEGYESIGNHTLVTYDKLIGSADDFFLIIEEEEDCQYQLINTGTSLMLQVSRISQEHSWQGGNGTWASGESELWGGGKAFYDGDTAIFDGTGTVSIKGEVSPGSTIVQGNGSLTLNGTGSISGNGNLVKNGTGTLRINNANTYTGETSVNGGTLIAANDKALGTGTVTLNGGTLIIAASGVDNEISAEGISSIAVQNGVTWHQKQVIHNSGTLNISGTLDVSAVGELNSTDVSYTEGADNGFKSGSDYSIKLVENTGTLTSNAVIKHGNISLTLDSNGLATAEGGTDYSTYYMTNGHAAAVSGIAAKSGGELSRIEMKGGVLTADESATVNTTGGEIKLTSGTLSGSISGAKLGITGGQLTATLTGNNTLSGNNKLSNVLDNDGILNITGTLDVTAVGALSAKADAYTEGGNNGFRVSDVSSIKVVDNSGTLNSSATITHGSNTLTLGSDGIAITAGTKDYSTYYINAGHTATASDIIAKSGNKLSLIQMTGGTLNANATTTANVSGGSVNLSAGILSGSISGAELSISGGQLTATLTGNNTLSGNNKLSNVLNNKGTLNINGTLDVSAVGALNSLGATYSEGGNNGFRTENVYNIKLVDNSGTINNTATIKHGSISLTLGSNGIATAAGETDYSTYYITPGHKATASAIVNKAGAALKLIHMTGGTLDLGGRSMSNNIEVNGIATLHGAGASSGMLTLQGGELSMDAAHKGHVMLQGGELKNIGTTASSISAGNVTLSGAALSGDFTLAGSSSWSVETDTSIDGSLSLGGNGELSLLNHATLNVDGTLNLDNFTLNLTGKYNAGESYTLMKADSIRGGVDGIVLNGVKNYTLNTDGGKLTLLLDQREIRWLNEKRTVWQVGGYGWYNDNWEQVPFENGNNVMIDEGTVTIVGNVSPGEVNIAPYKSVTLKSDKKTPGSITGGASVTISGWEKTKVTMNENNSYTGGTTIDGGIVTAKGDASFGKGDIVLNRGTLNLSGKMIRNSIILSGYATIKGGKKYLGDFTMESGSLEKGSQLDVKGTSTLAGGIIDGTLSGTGTLNVTGSVTLGNTGKLTTNKLTIADGGLLNVWSKGLAMNTKTSLISINGGALHSDGKLSANSLTMQGGKLSVQGVKPQAITFKGAATLTDAELDFSGKFTAASMKATNSDITLDNWTKAQSINLSGKGLNNSLTNSSLYANGSMKVAGNLTLNNSGIELVDLWNDKPMAMNVSGNLTLGSGSSLTLSGALSATNLMLNGGTINLTGAKAQTIKVKQSFTLNKQNAIDLNLGFDVTANDVIKGKAFKIITFKYTNLSFYDDLNSLLGIGSEYCTLELDAKGTSILLTVTDLGGWYDYQRESEEERTKATPQMTTAPAATTAEVDSALDKVSDTLVQSTWGAAKASRAFVDSLANRWQNATALDATGRGAAWGAALGATSRLSSHGGHHGADYNLSGAAFGVEANAAAKHSIGLAMGATWGKVNTLSAYTVDQDSTHIALYGQSRLMNRGNKGLTLDWSAAYGRSENDANMLGETYDWTQHTVQLDARLSYGVAINERTTARAFAGLQYQHVDAATPAAGVEADSLSNLRAEVGVGATYAATAKTSVYGEVSFIGDTVRDNP
ncbi:MAG: autotransporter-associated beta strand repeat-containing protein, partial [Akkermansia sp.]|nr:autotransporter-associated beta strand repeat-containing protein [Akkermansia sp.]